MAANTLPIFPVTPNFKASIPAFLATSLTVVGTAGLTLAFTAGAAGSRVDSLTFIAAAASTAGMVRVWFYNGSGNAMLLYTAVTAAVTPGPNVSPWTYEYLPPNWVLPAGSFLYASTEKNEGMNLHCRGGDY